MKLSTLISSALALALPTFGALQQVTDLTLPTNLKMYISVPSKLSTNPAIIVALHPCGGTAQQWYTGTKLPSHSETLGFILIYPQTSRYSNCWDVNAAASLTHNGGGDASGIIAMINHTLTKYPSADKAKVYVMGGSSGAMMTNVLAGSYPDVFAAAAAYSGTAFACFAGSKDAPTPLAANQTCTQGLSHTPAEWAQFVKNAYPSYTGPRPRVLIAHGLADTLVRPKAGYEALKQWAAVLGVSNTRNVTGSEVEEGAQYTKMVYGEGEKVVGYFGQGVGHIAPVVEGVLLKFFGLMA